MFIEKETHCIVGNMSMYINGYQDSLLLNLKGHLLIKTSYGSSNPIDWEIRNCKGELLNENKCLKDVELPDNKLFVTLKPGVGG